MRRMLTSRREATAAAGEMVTTGDIADRLDIEQNVVSNWVARNGSFPEPIRRIGKASVWWWPEVELWLKLKETK